jgi:hypothetical protein
MNLARGRGEGLVGNGCGQIDVRRNDDRPAQKSVQPLDFGRGSRWRSEHGDRDAALRDNDLIQLAAPDPIENLETFRLELAGADDPGTPHVILQMVIPYDWSFIMTKRFVQGSIGIPAGLSADGTMMSRLPGRGGELDAAQSGRRVSSI